MVKRFLFIIVICAIGSFSNQAQISHVNDSLKNIFASAKTDIERADIELLISKHYLGVFPDSVEIHANRAINIFKAKRLTNKVVEATLILAQSYKYQGYFDKAMSCVEGLLDDIRREKNELLLGKCYHFMGELCRATTLRESALQHLYRGLVIAHVLKNLPLQSGCHDRLAAVYFELKDYRLSKIYADSAINIAMVLGDYETVASSLDILGAIYTNQGDLKSALSVQVQAIEASAKAANPESILPNIYRNIANTYFLMKDFNKALEYGLLSYKMADKSKISYYMESSAALLSKVYAQKGNFEQAYKYADISKGVRTYRKDMEIAYRISEMNAKYDKAMNEKLISDQKEELAQIQLKVTKSNYRLIILLASSFLLLALLVLLIFFYIQKRRSHKKIMNQNLLIIEKNVELEKLTSEIRHQSNELVISNQQLQKLNDFKVFMTNMMVHDLKNPLNSIIGFSGFHPEDPHYSYINHSARSMLHLVSNMLDVQKYEKTEMQVMKQRQLVETVIRQSVDEIRIALDMRGLKVVYDIETGIEANFDSEIINRVIINLLTNAIKYSYKEQSITLSASFMKIDKKKYVKISVHNMGDAIPTNKLERIFDAFSDINSRKLGVSYATGLGLTFCRIAVKAHNGEMGVESAEEFGTTFWFTLEP